MESGGYGSAAAAHLSSPAMVVFSQAAAASGLSEAFRLQQRPFHSQVRIESIKSYALKEF